MFKSLEKYITNHLTNNLYIVVVRLKILTTNSEKKKKSEKSKIPASHTLTEDIRRRLDYLNRAMKNVDAELAVLEKRKQRYVEGLPKVEKMIAEYREKKKKLLERQEKELGAIRQLSATFLGEEHGD